MLLVSFLYSIFMQYDIKYIFAYSSDISIDIQIESTTVEEVPNNILISG